MSILKKVVFIFLFAFGSFLGSSLFGMESCREVEKYREVTGELGESASLLTQKEWLSKARSIRNKFCQTGNHEIGMLVDSAIQAIEKQLLCSRELDQYGCMVELLPHHCFSRHIIKLFWRRFSN